ncbi:unnamed protein product, partial [Prorocentrum cordatum]
MTKSDVCLIAEAHDTETSNSTWKAPPGTTAWRSEGASAGQAGVGVIVRDTFLRLFSEPPRWVHIWRGRAAKLCLRGTRGALDPAVVYAHAGNHSAPEGADLDGVPAARHGHIHSYFDLRSCLRCKVRDALASPEDCLAVLGGDFNYVTEEEDRIALNTMTYTGYRDNRDEQHFKATIGDRYNLSEMFQGELTHASASARSRLDRIYANFPLADQLDRRIRCSALEWRHDLSHHRAAMRLVASRIESERSTPPAATALEGRLGCTVKFIRAAEAGRVHEISTCLLRYPSLRDHVDNPFVVEGNMSRHLRGVRLRAIQLAREHAIDELGKSHADLTSEDDFRATQARQKNARLIYRLAPGRAGGVSAVERPDGEVVTCPDGKANALRSHWGQVFKAKGIDTALLRAWTDEDEDTRPLRDA